MRAFEGLVTLLLVGIRKRSGLHWTVDGAKAILALRCCISSGRFDDYWAYRATSS